MSKLIPMKYIKFPEKDMNRYIIKLQLHEGVGRAGKGRIIKKKRQWGTEGVGRAGKVRRECEEQKVWREQGKVE